MKKPVQIFNFSIVNSDSKQVDIHIDGDIVDAGTQSVLKAIFGDTTTTSYKSFRNQLDKLDADTYNVIINSGGGHVGDALAMYDYLVDIQQNKGKVVNTKGIGIVASAATLILLAGKQPEMTANSWFMSHEVSGGTYGSVSEVENYARTMRQFNDKIRDLYAERSGMRKEEVTKNLLTGENWLTAQQAKEKGLIAHVTGEQPFTNKIEKEDWAFENEAVLNSYNDSVKPPTTNILEDMKKVIAQWGKDLMAAIKGIPVTDKTTHADLLNSMGEVINSSVATLGEKLETEQNDAIANYIKSEAGKTVINDIVNAAVTTAVTAATAGFVKQTEFESEITNIKGSATQTPKPVKDKKEETPIGSFIKD